MQINELQAAALNTARERFFASWNPLHAPFPNRLYHYTSAAGLIGILSSRSLWLTDLRYMNDMSELQFAQQAIDQCISDKLSDPSLSEAQKEFLSRISRSYNPFDSGAAVYSASFCENKNLLSQWRAYRGQGGGYALGFDFFHTIRLLDRPCFLRRIIYGVEQQRSIIDDAVTNLLAGVHDGSKDLQLSDVSDQFLPAACQVFSQLAAELLFCLKHPDFHEEREWRLVSTTPQLSPIQRELIPPQFREFQGNIIPYYAVSYDRSVKASNDDLSGIGFPIQEVVIGPTVSGDLNESSLRTLMLSLSRDIVPNITKSEIPLRWL
ncbi:DUF2971 domain-containing protein [Solirhodobacter olei]|uniref:DUF2971 domain-containing protein n=1 Tax=Solirhodobacter olei TaxID=2493082 RepID=UPI0013E2EBB7|nr:DUF2971 domain-containing protein [Solirhodobacter olei]